jgi:hypothetical protein
MSTIKANDIQSASGGIPTVKGQRLIPTAWVHFDGTGTVAIIDSENVSSITDKGTGNYEANLITAMSNASYAVTSNTVGNVAMCAGPSNTSAAYLQCYVTTSGALIDRNPVSAIILGGQA